MINEYLDLKKTKKKMKLFFWIISSLFSLFGLFLILLILIVGIIAGKSAHTFRTSDYVNFSPAVEEYRNLVTNICEQEGISDYVNTILAIMQVSSQGIGSDPMCSADKEFNTEYGKNRGDIQITTYSIQCGVKEFNRLLTLCGVSNPDNQAMLAIVYEAYHLNRNYIDYAKEHGGYTSANADEFISSQDSLPYFASSTFSQEVAAYVKLKSNAFKKFIHPLSIYSILQGFNMDENNGDVNKKVIYKGSKNQAVLSASEGSITAMNTNDDISTISITTDVYVLTYYGIKDSDLCIGQAVLQGAILGYTSDLSNSEYGITLEVTKNGEPFNPEKILDVITLSIQPLDEITKALATAIGEYTKVCVGNIQYKAGGILVDGMDNLGFIHNVYSNHFNTDIEMEDFDLPYDSFDSLANYNKITYKIDDYIVPNLMYPGDIIFYKNDDGNYDHAAIYVGDSKVVHMTEQGCVTDSYNFRVPRKIIRVIGRKYLGLLWPLPGYDELCISSEFSPDRVNPVTGVTESHNGTDIAAPEGTAVVAVKDGTVISAGWSDSAGNNIVIDHGDGMYTYYMHSSELLVNTGDTVTQGQTIMKVGSTGQSTGNHLHFGLRIDGQFVNPMDYSFTNDK